MALLVLCVCLGGSGLGYFLNTTLPSYTALTLPGFPFAYGIFQEYYSANPPFKGSHNIALIGTCAMGIMYLSSPFVFGLLAWYPRQRRACILAGLVLMCLALGLSSLSTTVPHLIITQGVFYAIGGGMCYCPTITFMDEWFVKRKGLAFGCMWVCSAAFALSQPTTSKTDTRHRPAQELAVSSSHYCYSFSSIITASARLSASGQSSSLLQQPLSPFSLNRVSPSPRLPTADPLTSRSSRTELSLSSNSAIS